MADILRDQLHEALAALGEQLSPHTQPVHLVVVGGSALLATGLGDRATADVDVVALVVDGVLVTATPFPDGLRAAAARVARDFDLAANWLNPGPTSLLEIGGLPSGFAGRMTTETFGDALKISWASRVDLVHLKLYAYADRAAPRDEADLRRLQPTERELVDAAAWARTHNAPGPFDDQMAAALAAFDVQDRGR